MVNVLERSWAAVTSRISVWAGALLAFATAFAYRWLTVNFTNDQFVPLARAQHILRGELPVRDFFDPGVFLQNYTSAAALSLSGGTLLGEAASTIFFISLGAALTYVMATRLARSWIIGAAATATAVATFPRLYNYPKVFLFVLAIACAWRHQRAPTRGSLCVIAAVTAVAFLFRYDLAVYIGVSVIAFLAVLHWPRSGAGWRPLAFSLGWYGGVTIVLLLPLLFFIQSVVGIPRYLAGLSSQAREITTLRVNVPALRFDWAAPLVLIDPPSERRIHVRWKTGVGEEERRQREQKYGLSRPIADEGTTFSYMVTNSDRDNISALVADPAVDDTNGIDRERGELAIRESPFRRAQRSIPLLRMDLAPGVLTFTNAVAWLYYATLALPILAVATLIGRRLYSHAALDRADDRATVVMLITLCAIVGQSLVRESPETRLPDIAAPMAVLGAWVAGVWIRRDMRHFRARMAATLAFGCVTLWSAAAFGELGGRFVTTGVLAGRGGVQERFEKVNEYLGTSPPIDGWYDNGSVALRTLAQWLRACTTPTDRLLVLGWAPDLYFFADRPFAGGQVYLYPGWHSSAADQELTVERLKRQRTPVAISPVDGEVATRLTFPIVAAYVDQNYTHAMRSRFDSAWEYDVLVRRDISPVRTYEPLQLPCYR